MGSVQPHRAQTDPSCGHAEIQERSKGIKSTKDRITALRQRLEAVRDLETTRLAGNSQANQLDNSQETDPRASEQTEPASIPTAVTNDPDLQRVQDRTKNLDDLLVSLSAFKLKYPKGIHSAPENEMRSASTNLCQLEERILDFELYRRQVEAAFDGETFGGYR